MVRGDEAIPLSKDFTPETDRQRMQHLVSAGNCTGKM